MATSLQWSPTIPYKSHHLHHTHKRIVLVPLPSRRSVKVQAFRRSDFDGFAKRFASGEVWRDVWRSANNGFEQLVYESKKTAERIDRRYSVSRRLSAVADSAGDRARELDREFEITQRWRTFSLDFSRNWPRVWFLSLYLCTQFHKISFIYARNWNCSLWLLKTECLMLS